MALKIVFIWGNWSKQTVKKRRGNDFSVSDAADRSNTMKNQEPAIGLSIACSLVAFDKSCSLGRGRVVVSLDGLQEIMKGEESQTVDIINSAGEEGVRAEKLVG